MPVRRSLWLVAALLVALVPGARASVAQPAPAVVAKDYSATLGSTDLPWQRSDTNLNQPWDVGADGDGAWVAKAGGRNLVRFGPGAAQGLGRAGHLGNLWGRPTRWPADVTAVGDPGIVVQPAQLAAAGTRRGGQPPAGPAQLEERAIWLVDRDAQVAVGLPVWPDGDLGTPLQRLNPNCRGLALRWPPLIGSSRPKAQSSC